MVAYRGNLEPDERRTLRNTVKAIVHPKINILPFHHNLLTLISFKILIMSFLLWNTKGENLKNALGPVA